MGKSHQDRFYFVVLLLLRKCEWKHLNLKSRPVLFCCRVDVSETRPHHIITKPHLNDDEVRSVELF